MAATDITMAASDEPKIDITRAAGRSKLTPRKEPYWRKEGNGHLGFRCTGPDGQGNWQGRIRVGGKYAFTALGANDDYRAAQKDYNKWVKNIESTIKSGAGVSALEKTVADAAKHYMEVFNRTRPDDQIAKDGVRNRFERILLGREGKKFKRVQRHPLADVKLAALTKLQIKEFRLGLLKGVKEEDSTRAQRNTANRDFRQFIGMLNLAFKDSYAMSDEAWRGVGGFNNATATTNDSYRYMTNDERIKVIAAVDNELMQDFFTLMCRTGCRPVELVRLTAGDYNKHDGLLRLWSRKGKTADVRERFVPVSDMNGIVPVLNKLVKDKLPAAPLFEDVTPSMFVKVFQAAANKAGVKKATSYCLRHSFITDSINNGVEIFEVAKICGTSALMIDRTYGKLLREKVRTSYANLNFG